MLVEWLWSSLFGGQSWFLHMTVSFKELLVIYDEFKEQVILFSFLKTVIQEKWHLFYRILLIVIVIVTHLLVSFTIYIILTYSSTVHSTYKSILLTTLLFPAALTNIIGFFQPYTIFPHLIVYNLNPWFNSRFYTEIFTVATICLLEPFMICQIYAVWFNYIVLTKHTSRVGEQVSWSRK